MRKYLFRGDRILAAIVALVCVVGAAQSQARAETPDFGLIKTFGLFAEASYQTRETMDKIASLHQYSVDYAGTLSDAQLSYFIASNSKSKHQLIVVRGTANVENTIVDVSIKLVPNERSGILLHEGFAYAADKLFEALSPYLKKDYRISTTGHSLGGAVAMILAMDLDAAQYQLGPVITFGQPKVTNIPGARKYAHLPVLRVVTSDDLVPLVPPLDPLDLANIDVYWHLGPELILLPGKEYSRIGTMDSMLRATKIFGRQIGESNLKAHEMLTYLGLLQDKLEGSQEKAYENDFNLLNLFGN